MAGAYETGVYRNIFKECGYSEEEIEKRVKETFETIFYGSEEERFYHEACSVSCETLCACSVQRESISVIAFNCSK